MINNLELFSDEKLAVLSIKNPDLFGNLVGKYWNRLFRYVRRISYFEKEDVEDILQEAFIKIYKNLNFFDNSMKFSTWVYQITHNATIDAIRKKNARPKSIGMEEEDLAKIFKSSENQEKEIIFKERMNLIKNTIKELPLKYREALILRVLEEKTYEEMVDILKKPKGTVASLVNRGRKMIVDKIF